MGHHRAHAIRLALCCVLGLALAGCQYIGQGETADLLILNGKVYSLDWSEPALDGTPAADAPMSAGRIAWDAEAVAVKGGEILYVGPSKIAKRYRGRNTRVIDVGGATILPGFIDSHTHVMNLGETLTQLNLVGVETEEEAVAKAVEYARDVPAGNWIVGYGWDEGEWANRYPTMELLSEALPNHPVVLDSLHGFAIWGNRQAFERAGITAETQAPSGGEILRDAAGNPSGVMLNRATDLLSSAVPSATFEERKEQIVTALQAMAAAGYVAVHEAGVGSSDLGVFEVLAAEGQLPLRVYIMLSARDEPLLRQWLEIGPTTSADDFLTIRSVKAYYDGALGSRGARLIADYSDTPGHRGVSGDEYGFNEDLVADMMRGGFQVAIHAIGDLGNRETLDFIQSVVGADPRLQAGRHRIEHAQVVHPQDFPRFAGLGVIASMEPPHAMEDKSWAEERVGPVRIGGAYAWRTHRRAGTRLAFNSDLPGSDHNLFYGLVSAIARQDKRLEPPGGWRPEQNMTPEEAVRGYTIWNAYAGFVEDRTGVLAPGRWADITVIDVDPFQIGRSDPGSLLQGRVLLTVVDGKIVHNATGLLRP